MFDGWKLEPGYWMRLHPEDRKPFLGKITHIDTEEQTIILIDQTANTWRVGINWAKEHGRPAVIRPILVVDNTREQSNGDDTTRMETTSKQ